VRLAALRGQVVVLNFWASWCEPCRAEMPSLELMAERHKGDRLQVLAVNFRETDGTIRRFLAQTDFSLPILRDADGAAARAWQVRIFPSTVVIGRDGRAAFTVVGEVDWGGAEARAWIAPLL
jgi:thiol-disulfide isomerase/thioredoxin